MTEKQKPVISVVMPAWNESEDIKLTLLSLKHQKFQKRKVPFEVIVCNNDSTDDTAEVAAKYCDKVVFEKRRGHGFFPRNAAANAAEGKYLVHTDADTYFPPDFIERVHRIFRMNKYVVFGCGHWNLQSRDDNSKMRLYSWGFGEITHLYHRMQSRQDTLTVPAWCLCTPMSVWKKIGGFTEQWEEFEDVLYSYQVETLGKKQYFNQIKVRSSARRLSTGILTTLRYYGKKNSGFFDMAKNVVRKSKYDPNSSEIFDLA
ncbi:MAG: glycosyltransferase family 2 protein [archaeon]|nr:glycosyltransferase family 2 protein [archaeon]